jgi:glutathione S-transferase
MEMVFYTNPMSRSRIVRWMLDEIAYPYWARVSTCPAALRAAEIDDALLPKAA